MTQQNRHVLTEAQEARTRKVAELNPDAVRPRLRLAMHYWRKGDLASALEWIDRVLDLDPSSIGAFRVRANVLADMQQTAKAVETAMQARAADPQSVAAHILAVRMLLADLQPGKAQGMLDAAVDLDPEPQQLKQLKSLQLQILSVSKRAERNPLDWVTQKFNKRLANVAGEDPDAA